MEYMKIGIECMGATFVFEGLGDSCAWYDIDGKTSKNGDKELRINADREVYAIYTDEKGEKHYGTIGDSENEYLADNYPCERDEKYVFYENPQTKDYYI